MSDLLDQRRAGVLLHPSSLPGSAFCGDFGPDAYRFVDLLAAAGVSIWQVLPLGPTHPDGCPYQNVSVHAGNPDLVSLHWLQQRGWLEEAEAMGAAGPAEKRNALDTAFERFLAAGDHEAEAAFAAFCEREAHWLEDYARFQAFRDDFDGAPWATWPAELRRPGSEACERRAGELAAVIERLRFRQFVFQFQWQALRRHANERGVLLFGDMPIYVHLESADVWAHQGEFQLDGSGRPITVTGVPPDYFCAEGQLWGNPQYNWEGMRDAGFDWWLRRFSSAARQFDILRIDHFRGLQAYWEIPADADNAREGRWVPAPGRDLLELVRAQLPQLCLVAENLGTISPEVEALRRDFELPGMLILQFAFDGNPDNPYLPHRHTPGDIVYTGTHDNDTTLGWFESLDERTRRAVYAAFGDPAEPMPQMLVRQAMASVANTAIIPWQDLLGLDGAHRMNTPGTREGNWQWRFRWEQVPAELTTGLREMLAATGRLALAGDQRPDGPEPAVSAGAR